MFGVFSFQVVATPTLIRDKTSAFLLILSQLTVIM